MKPETKLSVEQTQPYLGFLHENHFMMKQGHFLNIDLNDMRKLFKAGWDAALENEDFRRSG